MTRFGKKDFHQEDFTIEQFELEFQERVIQEHKKYEARGRHESIYELKRQGFPRTISDRERKYLEKKEERAALEKELAEW